MRERRPSEATLRVLEALAEASGWTYGYDLGRRTGIAAGSLYPILIRLAARKQLNSRWLEPERPGRPPRHGYRLTAAGVAMLRAARSPRIAPTGRRARATT